MPETTAAPPTVAAAVQSPAAAPAPSAPKVSPKPDTKAFSRSEPNLNNAFDKLTSIVDEAPPEPAKTERRPAAPTKPEPKPEPTKPAEPAAEQPKDEHGKEEVQKEEVLDDASLYGEDEEPTAPAVETDKDGRPKVATLRQMFDAEKKVNDNLRKEIEKLKGGLKADDLPEHKQLKEEVESLRKEREQLLEEVKFTDYTRHPEFKEKYEKPYERSWNLGRAWVAQLKVKDPVTGEDRQGTAKDFDDLMTLNATDPDRAAEAVDMLFGGKAATVAAYMTRVNEALQVMQEARDEYKTKGSERDKQRSEQMSKTQTEVTKQVEDMWRKFTAEPVEKFPQFFKPIEGDDKANELLEKGYQQSKFALANLNVMDPRLTAQQRQQIVKAHAAIYNKAAAYGRLVHFVKSRDAKIAELQAELEQFKASEPKAGEGAKNAKQEPRNWEQQLETFAR